MSKVSLLLAGLDFLFFGRFNKLSYVKGYKTVRPDVLIVMMTTTIMIMMSIV